VSAVKDVVDECPRMEQLVAAVVDVGGGAVGGVFLIVDLMVVLVGVEVGSVKLDSVSPRRGGLLARPALLDGVVD
jgi:hypothetical protein